MSILCVAMYVGGKRGLALGGNGASYIHLKQALMRRQNTYIHLLTSTPFYLLISISHIPMLQGGSRVG